MSLTVCLGFRILRGRPRMMQQHDALPRSVGRIRVMPKGGGAVQGTGFLVSPTRVLTCAHCLRGPGSEERVDQGSISFTQARGAPEVPFKVLFDAYEPDAGLDVAVLELPHAVEGTACLSLSGEALASQTDWQTFGHPAVVEGAPLWLGGTVDGPIARHAAGRDGWLLSLRVDGESAPIEGMSGSPVLTDQGVVGVLSFQLYKRVGAEGGGKPTPGFSRAFAVPTPLFRTIPALRASIAAAAVVFIAYRRDSPAGKLVQELQGALEVAGHEAFLDLDIKVGEDWAKRIEAELGRADVFVPVLTHESLESLMLLEEVRAAYGRWRQTGRPLLLPVRDPTLRVLPFEFDTYLGDLQYAPWGGEQDTPSATRAIVAGVGNQALEPPPPLSMDLRDAQPMGDFRRIRMWGTALPPDDPFYFERPDDLRAYERLEWEKFVLTVIGPSGFGKTSLAVRLRQRCVGVGRPVLLIDFASFGTLPRDDGENTGYVTFLNDFVRVFCKGLKLPLPPQPIEDPTDVKAILVDATDRMRRLVVILDGVDRMMARPYGEQFFRSIRSWIEAVDLQCSFVLCIATELSDLMVDINTSPFNIDKEPVELEPLDAAAIRSIAERTSCRLTKAQGDLLDLVTGGHPVLTRQALAYVLAPGAGTASGAPSPEELRDRIADLHKNCGSAQGPFASSLKALWARIDGIHPRVEGDTPLLKVMQKIERNEQLTARETRLSNDSGPLRARARGGALRPAALRGVQPRLRAVLPLPAVTGGRDTSGRPRLQVSGTVVPGAVYIERPEDEQVYQLLKGGTYCNILTSRQMGKSSLVTRVEARLEAEGRRVVKVDVSGLGGDQLGGGTAWYRSLLKEVVTQLHLTRGFGAWWSGRPADEGMGARFRAFVEDFLLEDPAPIAVIFDEVDDTRRYGFTDDSFLAIRFLHNARADRPELERLTFCLVGVLLADDLIKVKTSTPYNVGQTVRLTDFSRETCDLGPLEAVLDDAGLQGAAVVDDVLGWTSGQPFLTMALCEKASSTRRATIEALVREEINNPTTFKVHFNRIEQIVRERIAGSSKARDRYLKMLDGEHVRGVPERDEESLLLAGLVHREADGRLRLRNRIYGLRFDERWVKEILPAPPVPRWVWALVAALVVAGVCSAASPPGRRPARGRRRRMPGCASSSRSAGGTSSPRRMTTRRRRSGVGWGTTGSSRRPRRCSAPPTPTGIGARSSSTPSRTSSTPRGASRRSWSSRRSPPRAKTAKMSRSRSETRRPPSGFRPRSAAPRRWTAARSAVPGPATAWGSRTASSRPRARVSSSSFVQARRSRR